MVQKKRLYQILRQAGLIDTKQNCLELLHEGRVKVDGAVCKNPDFQLNPAKKTVTVDDRPIKLIEEKLYLMLNKPPMVISHRRREHGKKHILELIDLPIDVKNTINPVGRLDYASRGLIILTNDGDFANQILQPKEKLEKEYKVFVKGELDDDTIKKLEKGITINITGDRRRNIGSVQYKTKPCKISIKKRNNQATQFNIIITEGKKRQIRTMMRTVGFRVLDLQRIRIGKLKLGKLKEGEYKEFRKDDVF